MSEQTSERSFDELAKGLASGTVSRGKALRLMGAALVGGALASLPGGAWASHKGTPHGGGGGGGGKSSCAKYCKTLFGGDTAAQEECVSQGAKGTGPCFECGAPGNPTPTCKAHEIFNPTKCACESIGSIVACTLNEPICSASYNCGGEGARCTCAPTVEGGSACIVPDCGEPCSSGADCPSGLCGAAECCSGAPVCLTPCGQGT